ncbi:MAG: hypothetical protein JO159_16205 [Acidobacteria bacterium]|nr:hypothetical protein [Acidobacteriota bacterium]
MAVEPQNNGRRKVVGINAAIRAVQNRMTANDGENLLQEAIDEYKRASGTTARKHLGSPARFRPIVRSGSPRGKDAQNTWSQRSVTGLPS